MGVGCHHLESFVDEEVVVVLDVGHPDDVGAAAVLVPDEGEDAPARPDEPVGGAELDLRHEGQLGVDLALRRGDQDVGSLLEGEGGEDMGVINLVNSNIYFNLVSVIVKH